jgi:hypothetical protein
MLLNKNILPHSIKYGNLTWHNTQQETALYNFNHKGYGTSQFQNSLSKSE